MKYKNIIVTEFEADFLLNYLNSAITTIHEPNTKRKNIDSITEAIKNAQITIE